MMTASSITGNKMQIRPQAVIMIDWAVGIINNYMSSLGPVLSLMVSCL